MQYTTLLYTYIANKALFNCQVTRELVGWIGCSFPSLALASSDRRHHCHYGPPGPLLLQGVLLQVPLHNITEGLSYDPYALVDLCLCNAQGWRLRSMWMISEGEGLDHDRHGRDQEYQSNNVVMGGLAEESVAF